MNIKIWIDMLPALFGYLAVIVGLVILAKWLIQLVYHVSDEDYEEIRYVNKDYNKKK